MSRVVNGIEIIQAEPDGVCQLCGKTDELRPYGPNGENICYDCGMKDPETTENKMDEYLFDKWKPIKPADN